MSSAAYLVGAHHTVRPDGCHVQTPGSVLHNDLSYLVLQLASKVVGRQDAVAALVEGGLATRMGIDVDARSADQLAPSLEAIRRRGWQVAPPRDGVLYPFIRAYRHAELPDVHIGIIPWVRADRHDYPLFAGLRPAETVPLMAQWQDLTGIPYSTRPGLLAHNVLRRTYETRLKRVQPSWVPDTRPETSPPVDYTCEPVHTIDSWSSPRYKPVEADQAGMVSLDQNGAYIGIYVGQQFARYGLRSTGRIKFDKELAGYWWVELAPWQHDLFPHPAGISDQTRRWVTTHTLELLTSLTESGHYGGFEVIDSWTSKAYPVLREMGECLRDVIYTPGIAEPLRATAKAAYKEFHGMCVSPSNRTRRGDWYAAIRGAGRVGPWRRAWKAFQTEKVAPVAFQVDAVLYHPDHVPSDRFFKRGEKLGEFKEVAA